jgi:hypothetical protein
MDDLINMELQMELKVLRKEVEKLKKENTDLKKVLVENDLGDEIGVSTVMSPEEEICVKGIEQILELVKNGVATKNDVQNFDILHKNLRMIKGIANDNKAKKSKPAKIGDLLKIVNESNND